MRIRTNEMDFLSYQKPDFLKNLQALKQKNPERYNKTLSKYQRDMKEGHFAEWLESRKNPNSNEFGSFGTHVAFLPSGIYNPEDVPDSIRNWMRPKNLDGTYMDQRPSDLIQKPTNKKPTTFG